MAAVITTADILSFFMTAKLLIFIYNFRFLILFVTFIYQQ